MHKFMGLKFLAGLGLLAGVGLVACRMAEFRHEMLTEGADEAEDPRGHHHLGHGHWHRRVPPMFEYWHRQAHAQDQAPAPDAEKAKAASEPAKA